MKDYKDTLNLPKTDFPMKANLSQREADMLAKWKNINLYQQLRERHKKSPSFILHDGPPYANGHIHMGHAVNKILKDMVNKSKALAGFNTPYVPGWDCHGLPIELNVEKKIGKAGQKVSAKAFREACREYALSQIHIQREEFERLGVLADWQNFYSTMDYRFEAGIIRSLAKIMQQGHVQKGYKPVHWCLDCSSALAEAEVEYADKTSTSIDVKFSVINLPDFYARFNLSETKSAAVVIWTTTPWTLPANQAVALHPEIEYALVETPNEYLLIAEPLVASAMQRYHEENYHVRGKVLGKSLESIFLQHPFYARQVPIVLGEHVTVESGTGAVHTAPSHGQDDFAMGIKYQLPLDNPVADDGCFTANTEIFAGLHVTKVNDLIIEELQSRHKLLFLTKITHSYPHCWRHKTPLIFRTTPQWFVNMDKKSLRKATLNAIKKVKWVPDWGQARISLMIENRPDWCISRQRTWGVPIPLFFHKENGEMHPRTLELMEKIASDVEQQGIEAWFQLDEKSLLGADAAHYQKCNDILDVWFDSGVTHKCVLEERPELHFPADMYLEGSDQYRGWFQSSLITAVAMHDTAPYKIILTHGFVLDTQGQKMSKSLGNVLAPEKIIQTLGADILRLWVASIDYRSEIHVSTEILARTAETYRRLRNTARFLLANLAGFIPEEHTIAWENMLALDQWVVDKTRLLQEDIMKAYETFQFHVIYQKIHHFCVVDLGGFYLDVIKDRQYTTPTNSLARRSAQTALFYLIEALVRWLSPILSFTAEEIWQYIPGKRAESVFLAGGYIDLPQLPSSQSMNQTYWEKMREVRDAVNKELEVQRAAGKLGAPLEADVFLYCDPKLKKQLDGLGDELRFVLITSGANVLSDAQLPVDAIQTEIPGLALKVQPLAAAKCERCWHRRNEVGSIAAHPTVCYRCVENIEGEGEVRKYA